MEVGSLRERIIIALLIYKFGEANVETEIPIREPEDYVKLGEKRIRKFPIEYTVKQTGDGLRVQRNLLLAGGLIRFIQQ